MYRIKDFTLMNVFDLEGNKLGFIKDAILDINENKIKGFSISSFNFLKNNINVLSEDIVSFNEKIVIKKITKDKLLEFRCIKGINVIDKKNNLIGILEDIIFNKNDFKIHGLIVSSGIFNDIKLGKRIILVTDVVLKKKNILYLQDNDKIRFFILPHKLIMDDGEYEKL